MLNFNLLDNEGGVIGYNQLFYKIVENVNGVILLKMFINFTKNDNKDLLNEARSMIVHDNKKAIIVSAFFRCFYFSIKNSPEEQMKD